MFGSLLVDELRDAYDVVPTTRETLDLRDVAAVARAARGAYAFACAAGPFQQLDRAIVQAVVEEGVHWLDIADDARWFFDLVDDASLDALARERGVVVMPGLSSLPAISCAMVHVQRAQRAKITLFIGNDNAKGAAAIASGSALNSPDRELLRREGIDATARSRFELPGAALAMRALRVLPVSWRVRLAKALCRLIPRFGSQGGYVEVNGERLPMTQRTAILPLVYALAHLDGLKGCLPPTVLDAQELLLGCASASSRSQTPQR